MRHYFSKAHNTQNSFLLALCLFGDVSNGGSFLANNCSHVLRRYQQSQRDVNMLGFRRDSRTWGPTTRHAMGSITRTSAIIWPTLPPIKLRSVIRDVGDTQGVVLKLISIQLLDGSEKNQAFALCYTKYSICYR